MVAESEKFSGKPSADEDLSVGEELRREWSWFYDQYPDAAMDFLRRMREMRLAKNRRG
jgi:hypothetical protein